MQPVVQALRQRFGNEMEFVVADVQTPEGQELAQQFMVNSIPAMFILDAQGNPTFNEVGYTEESVIADAIEKVLPTKK